MLFPIFTICGGLLAASSFVIAKQPSAERLFARIAPYQGMVGLGLLTLSLWWLYEVLPNFGALFASTYGLLALAAIVLNGAIGFLLGFNLLQRLLLSKNPAAEARGRELQGKLVPIQTPLGLAAAAVGTLALLL